MANAILPIGPLPPVVAQAVAPARTGDFKSVLERAVGAVEGTRREADGSVDRLLSGQDEEVHHVALAVERAELTFDLFLQVRNKVIEAYQEIMRMQM